MTTSSSDFRKRIGLTVRNAREENKISGTALAEMIGISQGALSNSERGLREFKLAEIAAAADVLGTTVDDILNGKGVGCLNCGDRPPAGFACTECGAIGEVAAADVPAADEGEEAEEE